MNDDSEQAGYTSPWHDGRVGYLSRPPMLAPEIYERPDLEERTAILASVISVEILPRLLQHHHTIQEHLPEIAPPSQEEIEAFGALVIGPDINKATAYFRKMQAKGHSLDTLFVHFLEPTARYLGELWIQDKCDFIDVTIGVARLQELLTLFSSAIEIAFDDLHHHALLMTLPGEQHLFGIDMVAKFMRAAGWTVTASPQGGAEDGVELVKTERFGVVGLTMSSEERLDVAARTIAEIRRTSMNASIGIMVGGPLFRDNRALAVQIGADAAAPDAPSAVILAKKLLMNAAIRV